MNTALEISIGVDVRHWVTFTIPDVTPEERAVLEGDDTDAALGMLARIERDQPDRAEFREDDHDRAPDYFGETADIIDVRDGS